MRKNIRQLSPEIQPTKKISNNNTNNKYKIFTIRTKILRWIKIWWQWQRQHYQTKKHTYNHSLNLKSTIFCKIVKNCRITKNYLNLKTDKSCVIKLSKTTDNTFSDTGGNLCMQINKSRRLFCKTKKQKKLTR